MSLSVLYQCFGIHGYHHLCIWCSGGAIFLRIVGSSCGFYRLAVSRFLLW